MTKTALVAAAALALTSCAALKDRPVLQKLLDANKGGGGGVVTINVYACPAPAPSNNPHGQENRD